MVILLYHVSCLQPSDSQSYIPRSVSEPHSLTPPSPDGLDMGGEPSGQREDPRGDTSLQVTEKLVPLTAGEENKHAKNSVCADS